MEASALVPLSAQIKPRRDALLKNAKLLPGKRATLDAFVGCFFSSHPLEAPGLASAGPRLAQMGIKRRASRWSHELRDNLLIVQIFALPSCAWAVGFFSTRLYCFGHEIGISSLKARFTLFTNEKVHRPRSERPKLGSE